MLILTKHHLDTSLSWFTFDPCLFVCLGGFFIVCFEGVLTRPRYLRPRQMTCYPIGKHWLITIELTCVHAYVYVLVL